MDESNVFTVIFGIFMVDRRCSSVLSEGGAVPCYGGVYGASIDSRV